MSDRWNPKKITVVPEKPCKVFVPGGDETVTEKSGWTIRERGDRTGMVVHAYRCEVHGVFDARVPRADVPDEVPCDDCLAPSRWAGSFCGQGHAAGEVMS